MTSTLAKQYSAWLLVRSADGETVLIDHEVQRDFAETMWDECRLEPLHWYAPSLIGWDSTGDCWAFANCEADVEAALEWAGPHILNDWNEDAEWFDNQ